MSSLKWLWFKSPTKDRSIGRKSSQDLVLGGTQFRFIWNHQVIMIEDCQETKDATLLGTPFVISLCPRGQFHHVVMQAIWNHGKSWCWRSKDSSGQGLTGCQKRNAQVERREWCISKNLLFWTFYNKLCTSIGMESQIYTNIHPTFCLSKIPNIKYPKKVRWRCQPCKDARVHYSFVEPGGQEWWKWTGFLGIFVEIQFLLLFHFHLTCWMISQDSSFDAAWPGEFFRWILLDLEKVENEEKTFWMQRFTGGFGSHQHGSWAATLPCLRGWDRRDKGVKRVDKKAGKPWIFREGLRR